MALKQSNRPLPELAMSSFIFIKKKEGGGKQKQVGFIKKNAEAMLFPFGCLPALASLPQ